MKMRISRGFTLIELLIVIALIALLAAAVIIALNPARQFALARDSTRWSNVSAINGAIQQNIAENRGVWCPTGPALPTSTSMIIAKTGGIDICDCLVPSQLAALPYDPSDTSAGYNGCADYNTGYTIIKNATTMRITVAAPHVEIASSTAISVTQ